MGIYAVGIAFVLVIVLVNKKVSLGSAMLIGTLVVGLGSGNGLWKTGTIIVSSLLDPVTVELLSIIAFICILGHMLKKFGLLTNMVEAMDRLLPSTKATIMLVPMMIGCLTVSGGAIISAPMVDNLGERLNLPPNKKSAINLLYRHGGHFMFPFVSGILLASSLGQISATRLAAMMIPVSLVVLVSGYFLFLRKAVADHGPDVPRNFRKDLMDFLINGSPLLLSLFLALVLGMRFPYALLIGIGIAALLAYRQGGLTWSDAWAGLVSQRLMIFATAGIMIFRGMINEVAVLPSLVNQLIANGLSIELLLITLPAIVAYATGGISSAMGITMPMLVAPTLPEQTRLVYAMLIYCSGYLGYFTSPLHLCTVLTNEFFGAKLSDTYRDLAPSFASIFVMMIVLMFVYR
ncbi:MAG: DUF401 family protein [Bacillota bacterium]